MCIDEDLLILIVVGAIVFIAVNHSRVDVFHNKDYVSAKQMKVDTEEPLPTQVKNFRKEKEEMEEDASDEKTKEETKDPKDKHTKEKEEVVECRASHIPAHCFPRTKESHERLLKRINEEMNLRYHQYD